MPAGTFIATPNGARNIQTLNAGDTVLTHSNGPQVIRWIGSVTCAAQGDDAPICFPEGVLDNTRQLLVSPQHRILLTGWKAELLFGQDEILVPAKAFLNDDRVFRKVGGMVTYYHILFDQHELLCTDGIVSESFHPQESRLNEFEDDARSELLSFFPELTVPGGHAFSRDACASVTAHEAVPLFV